MRASPLLATAVAVAVMLAIAALPHPAAAGVPSAAAEEAVAKVRKALPIGATTTEVTRVMESLVYRCEVATTKLTREASLAEFKPAMDVIAEKAGKGPNAGRAYLEELVPDKNVRSALRTQIEGPDASAFVLRYGLKTGAVTEMAAAEVDDVLFLYASRLKMGGKLSAQEKALLDELVNLRKAESLVEKDGKYIVKRVPTAKPAAATAAPAAAVPPKEAAAAATAVVRALKLSDEQVNKAASAVLQRRSTDASLEVAYWKGQIARPSRTPLPPKDAAKSAFAASMAKLAEQQRLELLRVRPASLVPEVRVVEQRVILNAAPSANDVKAATAALAAERSSLTTKLSLARMRLRSQQMMNAQMAAANPRAVRTNTQFMEKEIRKQISDLEARLTELTPLTGDDYALLIPAATTAAK